MSREGKYYLWNPHEIFQVRGRKCPRRQRRDYQLACRLLQVVLVHPSALFPIVGPVDVIVSAKTSLTDLPLETEPLCLVGPYHTHHTLSGQEWNAHPRHHGIH